MFVPDEILLYGIQLNTNAGPSINEEYAALSLKEGFELRFSVFQEVAAAGGKKTKEPRGKDEVSVIAAYGYAYEGHCYRFDKPKLFVFPYPLAGAPPGAKGCGFDGLGYSMWRMRSLDEVLELNIALDTLEKLALEANLPGKRAPTSYEANMQVAHRGGRLTT
ncbi:hypothetical protein QNA08_08120 [Chelatococcus sp. SYSU_G07232]|uniref:Uncharacterized protein n=1 Tax=Chelatococcus albus TaxID=3047466 RepID=A0ABT7AGS2_9HYPH|nr:hypothetical protein [Chelatococcus sp. SYSU_G07232]MDJ1158197.1 hypothetical protein [Chelatococcus sp. SYSU_G07232]